MKGKEKVEGEGGGDILALWAFVYCACTKLRGVAGCQGVHMTAASSSKSFNISV